ncbi:MAG TPA: TonB family protein [Verrucomicrobiae bacterium]|jgi:TonB family protein|nr:TonB family protein [Verrucomicrobiae bacterium]
MTEASKQWEGQIVDGVFPLRQYLGGSDHSAVFLTEYSDGEPQKTAIKLFPAKAATADAQISSWEFASQLSHPNLLRLFRGGRCRIDGNDLLFLVMEYAEEDLSQILPQRALTTEETRDMLCPVLDALEYLHGKGFVHGDLKPANILAIGDHLKISSDAISRIGEAQSSAKRAGAYDPPEAISGMLTPTADVWSLGTTLVEVLTQHLPEWQPGLHREPVVPAGLPAPFLEIAQQCLRLEPHRRISVRDIAARMNSRAAVASASASVAAAGLSASPAVVAGQLSPLTPRPMASQPVPPRPASQLQSNPHRPPPYRESGTRPRFLVPLIVAALAFAAILTVPRLLTHRAETPSARGAASNEPARSAALAKPAAAANSPKPKVKSEREPAVSETGKSAAPTAPEETQRAALPSAPGALTTTNAKEKPAPVAPVTAPPVLKEAERPAAGGIASAKGEVLDQVLPDVSAKARATIHGKVRVSVKVHVDPAGGVSAAEFDSPGPSKFFADLALQAARKWAFTPPELNGKSVASEWRLRFEFTQSDTKVIPAQTAP